MEGFQISQWGEEERNGGTKRKTGKSQGVHEDEMGPEKEGMTQRC